jgi:hypothetical protein
MENGDPAVFLPPTESEDGLCGVRIFIYDLSERVFTRR